MRRCSLRRFPAARLLRGRRGNWNVLLLIVLTLFIILLAVILLSPSIRTAIFTAESLNAKELFPFLR